MFYAVKKTEGTIDVFETKASQIINYSFFIAIGWLVVAIVVYPGLPAFNSISFAIATLFLLVAFFSMYRLAKVLSEDKGLEPLISINSSGIKFRENITFSFRYLPWSAIEKLCLSERVCLNIQGSRYTPRPAVAIKMKKVAAQTSKSYGNLKLYDESGYQLCGYLDKNSVKELRKILNSKKSSWEIELETTEKLHLNA